MRWNLLKEIILIEKGTRAVSQALWPESSISPEILLLEMMAQTAGLALGAQNDFSSDVVFGKIEQAVFDLPLEPPALLEIEAGAAESRAEGAWFDAHVLVRGSRISSARLLLLNAGRLSPAAKSSVTFHESFLTHYRVREKVIAPAGQAR